MKITKKSCKISKLIKSINFGFLVDVSIIPGGETKINKIAQTRFTMHTFTYYKVCAL